MDGIKHLTSQSELSACEKLNYEPPNHEVYFKITDHDGKTITDKYGKQVGEFRIVANGKLPREIMRGLLKVLEDNDLKIGDDMQRLFRFDKYVEKFNNKGTVRLPELHFSYSHPGMVSITEKRGDFQGLFWHIPVAEQADFLRDYTRCLQEQMPFNVGSPKTVKMKAISELPQAFVHRKTPILIINKDDPLPTILSALEAYRVIKKEGETKSATDEMIDSVIDDIREIQGFPPSMDHERFWHLQYWPHKPPAGFK
jgi:hypothetical protein